MSLATSSRVQLSHQQVQVHNDTLQVQKHQVTSVRATRNLEGTLKIIHQLAALCPGGYTVLVEQ